MAQTDMRYRLDGCLIGSQVRAQFGVAALQLAACLPDDEHRVSNELGVVDAERSGDLDRMKQGAPFGIAAVAMANIVAHVRFASYHDGGFHIARIGTTAAVEVNPDPIARHGRARRWTGQLVTPPAKRAHQIMAGCNISRGA